MTPAELDHGAALLAAATPGPWEVWTSNSYRRITQRDRQDGGVLHGYAQNDGHGDLGGRNWESDLALIVWARNNLPGLLASARQAQDNAKDAERYRWLRDHKCNQLYVDRDGDHACNYMSAADWIAQEIEGDATGNTGHGFADVTPDELQRMKDTNTIWRVQIYPDTPVGSYTVVGATLDSAIDAAIAAATPGKGEA